MKRKNLLCILSIIVFSVAFLVPNSQAIKAQSTYIPTNFVYLPLVSYNYPRPITFGAEINALSSSILDSARDANLAIVRYNGLLWSDVQPTSSSDAEWENVAGLEENLILARQKNIDVILIVRGTPTWAQKYPGYTCGPMSPETISAFADFMKSVVSRYSEYPFRVKYYEIWNEPDVDPDISPEIFSNDASFGCWGDDSQEYYGGEYYADMLKSVYPAIKSANPTAQVVIGGLLLNCDPRQPGSTGYCQNGNEKPGKFFEGILKNSGGDYFDIVSFHGYTSYQSGVSPIQSEQKNSLWSAKGGAIAGKVDYLNDLLSQYDLEKPLFLTESGLRYNADPTDEFQKAKADYLFWLYARNGALGVENTMWYTLDGPGWENSGLLDQNQNSLPAYDAVTFLASELEQAEFSQAISPGGDTIGFEYVTTTKRVWLVFSPDGSEQTIPTPSGFLNAYYPDQTVITAGASITFSRPLIIELTR